MKNTFVEFFPPLKHTVIAIFTLIALFSASMAVADDPPDPSTGEAIIAAGSLGVVMITVGSTSGGGWSDFTSDDLGALQVVSTSINGIPAMPSLYCVGVSTPFGAGKAVVGDRIAILYFNPTESPIDVTVTADFQTLFFSCPPN